MFDNPIDDAVPGKPTICGWPWHGRLDMPSAPGAIPELTLKNGQVIPLAISLGKPERREWHQHGTVLRFRDPRAVDPIRTPAELAADEARGVSWRADVLYAPREGVLYGQAPTEGRLQTWLYHDGERNWRVRFRPNNSLLMRSQLIVVGRKRPVIAQQVVSVSYPDGVPELSNMSVVDAMPTGNRVLFALYDERWIFGVDGASFDQEALGAWNCPPCEFWELTISSASGGAAVSATFRRIRDEMQTLSMNYGQAFPSTAGGAAWVTIELVGGGTQTTYWGNSKPPKMDDVAVDTIESWGRNSSESSFESIVGLYYEGGSIKEVRTEYVVTRSFEIEVLGPSFSVSLEAQWVGMTLVPGVGVFTGTYKYSGESQITARLIRDGVEVSRAVSRVSSNGSRAVNWSCSIGRYAVVPQYDFYEVPFSVAANITLDGRVVLNRTNTLMVGGINTFVAQATSWTSRTYAFSYGFAAITSVRYSAQMIALAVNVTAFADDGYWAPGATSQQFIGRCATPSGIVPATSFNPRLPPLGHLYGSWNPVTKESIRDALNPVFWV